MIRCGNCKLEKDEIEFHKNKTKPLGRSTTCKACYKDWFQGYYAKNEAKRKQNSADWISRNTDRIRTRKRVTRHRYDIQIKARAAVNNAIRSKRFPQAIEFDCFDCKFPAAEWDHYNGHDKANWFNVDPVCRDCHAKREKVRRVALVQ